MQLELTDPDAPAEVRKWAADPPDWVEVHETEGLTMDSGLDDGEAAAIALAEALHADLVLIDERQGFRAAQRKGLRVTGTIGVLDLAAERGMIDFAQAMAALESTSFRLPAAVMKTLLTKHVKPEEE